MPPSPGTRIIDYDSTFFLGVKSDCDPNQTPQGYAWMTINMLNTGGVLSCRPGYRCIITLPDGNLQGSFLFRPEEGLEQMVIVIDGKVYVASYPFTDFRVLDEIQLSPYARQVYWAQTVQSAERIDNSFTSAIRVITPRAILFIQDGGLTAPAWYDGSNAGHVSGNPFETPSGGDMAWVGDRLWVARNHQLFASDISNPFSFRESDYLGGQVSFFFRSDITALVVTPSTESPQLMCFTDVNGSIIQANIRDRSLWNTTPNFQEEVIGVGCLSSRSAVSHYGRLVWYSPSGVAMYDPATSGKLTNRLPVRDNEMLVSKATLSEDLSTVATGIFGQYLLISVPAEDVYNRHTWVMNHASLATLNDESGPSWCGYWLGTRPVEWMSGQVANVERIYHISVDFDGKNRLWEAFIPDRLDNKCPITWGILSRGYFGATATIQQKAPGVRCRLSWVDLAFAAIEEDLNLGVFYAGGTRGAFRQMMNKLVTVEKGSLKYDQEITAESEVYAFKPQSRQLRTEDANQQVPDNEQGSCGVETSDADNIDTNFQLLIVGHGPATLKWVRPFAFLVPEDFSGDPEACVDETKIRAVRFDGVGTEQDNYGEAVSDLALRPLADYTSHKTVPVEQNGFLSVGVGFGESVVSQEAADRVAGIVAVKMAENELAAVNPLITSIGLGSIRPAGPPNYSANVIPDPTIPDVVCPAVLFSPLPDAPEWTPYSQQLSSFFGPAPLVYTLLSAGLPTGLTMSPTGLISGTPESVPSINNFEVKVRNANGKNCQQFVSLRVVSAFGVVNWDEFVWDTVTGTGGGFVAFSTPSSNSISYNLIGGTPFTGAQDAVGTAIGHLVYTGPPATCKVTHAVVNAGNFVGGSTSPCDLNLVITQDGVSRLSKVTTTPNNPGVGSNVYNFTIGGGISSQIQISFIATSHAGTHVQAITGTLIFSMA